MVRRDIGRSSHNGEISASEVPCAAGVIAMNKIVGIFGASVWILLLTATLAACGGGSETAAEPDQASPQTAQVAVESPAQSTDASAGASSQQSDMVGQQSFTNLLAELPSEEAAANVIAAGDLIDEYIADSEAALAKYTDVTLTISGIVEKKGRDFRNFSPYLDINGEVTSETHQIRCNLQTISERSRQRGVQDEDPTEPFSVGDSVTVVGTLKAIPSGAIGKRQILLSPCALDEN